MLEFLFNLLINIFIAIMLTDISVDATTFDARKSLAKPCVGSVTSWETWFLGQRWVQIACRDKLYGAHVTALMSAHGKLEGVFEMTGKWPFVRDNSVR